MKRLHLLACMVTVLAAGIGLVGGTRYARAAEARYMYSLPSIPLPIVLKGGALQREAFRHPDLLPIYGSSEISIQGDFSAVSVFHDFPTGFAPFEVASGGVNALVLAQQVAAVGPEIRGKKVVISFTPAVFFDKMIHPGNYRDKFSALQAYLLAFSDSLSFDTKQAAARRMLDYPQTLENDPLLRFALQRLANDSPVNRALYHLVWPLGQLRLVLLDLQDHRATLQYVWGQPLDPDVPHRPAAIDWSAMETKAEKETLASTGNNPFGIDDARWQEFWQKRFQTYKAAGVSEPYVLSMIQNSTEWTDLDILLRVLRDLGAQPLILSRPMPAAFLRALGVSDRVSQAFYARLHQVVEPYRMPLVDFAAYENDKYFSMDPDAHPSARGWVTIDETLDAFYHGTLQ